MLKRTLFFSKPYYLSLKYDQLLIHPKDFDGMPEGDNKMQSVPIEDIGFIILEHPQISFTLRLAEHLSSNNVAVVLCDSKHMPASMLLPLESHHIQGELYRHQIAASIPLKKNLWKQTIESKILNQSRLLDLLGINSKGLRNIAANVKSGDADNREGFAARLYWQAILGKDFVRDRYGKPPNHFLNYGYILLRAAVARAIVGSGLLATLGIHHRNRYNAFCLADDIMEPYRPWVDRLVLDLCERYPDAQKLSIEQKSDLLKLFVEDVRVGGLKRPLMLALSQTTASLARCFTGEARKISYPIFE